MSLKQWKFQSRNTRRVELKDFTKSFQMSNSAYVSPSPISLNAFKIATSNFGIQETRRSPRCEYHISSKGADTGIYSWGSGKEGELGHSNNQDEEMPRYVEALNNVLAKQIACGAGHSLILSNAGTIYAWGFNVVGQLGLGDFIDRNKPCLVKSIQHISIEKVSSGAGHCFAISTKGNMFAWGSGGYYQNCSGSQDNLNRPLRMDELGAVKEVSGGIAHSLILKNDGTVWSVGLNDNGQCGVSGLEIITKPKPIEALKNSVIVKLAAGGSHSLFLLESGELLSCGLNSCGQLGINTYEAYSYTPNIVKILKESKNSLQALYQKDSLYSTLSNITSIYAGEEVSAALDSENRLYVWGWNGGGQLAQGHFSDILLPVRLEIDEKVIEVCCGVSSLAFITESKVLYTCGYIGEFKLFKENSVKSPDNINSLRRLSSKYARFIPNDIALARPQPVVKEKYKSNHVALGRTHIVCTLEMIPQERVQDSIELDEEAVNFISYRNMSPELTYDNDWEPLPEIYKHEHKTSLSMAPIMEIHTANPFHKRPFKSDSRQQSRKMNIDRASTILTSYRVEFRQKLAEKSAEYAKFRRKIDEKMEIEKLEIIEKIKEDIIDIPKMKEKTSVKKAVKEIKTKEGVQLIKLDVLMKNSPGSGIEIDRYRGLVDKYETIIQRQILQTSQKKPSNSVGFDKLRRIGGGFVRPQL